MKKQCTGCHHEGHEIEEESTCRYNASKTTKVLSLFLFQNLLRPLLEFVKFPPELVPMALMRPLSGSGSQGVLVEILTNEGLSETIKYTAATMFGSTETTFYVLAVYFGSVAVRRTRHAVAAGLCADLAGVIAAVVICRAMFG